MSDMPVRGRSLDKWEAEHIRPSNAAFAKKTVVEMLAELAPLVPKGHAVEINAEGATITTPEGQTLPLEEWGKS
jgi:hypothetical protein